MNHKWLEPRLLGYEDLFPVSPCEHQRRAVPEVLARLRKHDAVTMCMPTGAGKSNVSTAMMNLMEEYECKASLYLNRKMLTLQTAKGLRNNGFRFGVRAASMNRERRLGERIQISSMQTEIARCLKGGQKLHDAELVVVDEAHLMAQGDSLKILQMHMAMGAKILLVTATPIGLSHISKELYVGATNSELRAWGAHVPVIVKCLNEMDLCKVRRVREKDEFGNEVEKLNMQDFRKHAWHQAIVGKVFEDYVKYNPNRRMAMGVAPGVPESRALALHFERNGVRVAHIDAKEVYVDGDFKTDNSRGDLREKVLERWQAGDIDVVWTCQVLREGIDLPSLYHLILATPILNIKDRVQVCGRVQRKSEQTPDHVLITDHGGSTHTFLSPNRDIEWHELYFLDDKEIKEAIDRRKKDHPDEVGAVCPKCGTMVAAGRKCPPSPIGCGEPIDQNNPKKLRFVVQESGELVTYDEAEAAAKPRKVSTDSQEQKQWDRLYWAAANSKKGGSNFNQLFARYMHAHGNYPPKTLNNMPFDEADWGRKVRDVPKTALKTKYNTPVDSGEVREYTSAKEG